MEALFLSQLEAWLWVMPNRSAIVSCATPFLQVLIASALNVAGYWCHFFPAILAAPSRLASVLTTLLTTLFTTSSTAKLKSSSSLGFVGCDIVTEELLKIKIVQKLSS